MKKKFEGNFWFLVWWLFSLFANLRAFLMETPGIFSWFKISFFFPDFSRHFSFMFLLSLNHFTLKFKTLKFMCWWHDKNKRNEEKCVEEFWHWFVKMKKFYEINCVESSIKIQKFRGNHFNFSIAWSSKSFQQITSKKSTQKKNLLKFPSSKTNPFIWLMNSIYIFKCNFDMENIYM